MPAVQDADPLAAERAARNRRARSTLVLLLIGLRGRCGRPAALVLGREALPSPLATVQPARPPSWATRTSRATPGRPARAFFTALAISLVAGLVAGLALGAHRLSGEVAEPLLVGALLDPEDHALSGDPAAVRARHLGQDRVRRDPRHHSGDPVHHERGAQHPRRLSARGARDAADRRCRPPRPSSCRPRCRRSSPASASASR